MLLLAQCAPTCAPTTPPPPAAEITIPALGSGTTPYRLPVADVGAAGWGTTHAEYTATDIFVRCGAAIVSPVNGVVVESRRVSSYDPSVDDPATRGGRSVAIVGDDGVRYYMAHFEQIDAAIEPGVRVQIGQLLGLMGMTGRASACHVHFALSPPCPGPEWSVRRGVIWPYRYLDDWRAGGQRSPVAEIQQWVADHPDGCALAMADPYAAHA
jgi:murein DD-endopeptidase MepM/ murein hydrolase activator NlpD